MEYQELSHEQQRFIDEALTGKSILADACIGSGKTTAIQTLCNLFSSAKRILYLTYNMLLKLDAREKIKNKNVDVTNYHGFAYQELRRYKIRSGVQDCILKYCLQKLPTKPYQVLIIDEYQDIDQEISDMLYHIKSCNPGLQIIAVGDMEQKIYDRTRLDAARFITEFLPDGFVKLEFTRCFRLNPTHAAYLGKVWNKSIVGVNPSCKVAVMSFQETFEFLARQKPGKILCLGANSGARSKMLNALEWEYPKIFNKKTVWSNISDKLDGTATRPSPGVAVFTTYDGCKGMEREICVVFNWTFGYWNSRLSKSNARYTIIRNIFCVAASRGKSKIIFVKPERNNDELLTERDLMDDPSQQKALKNIPVSGMFDFKFSEDIEAAYKTLAIKLIQPSEMPIEISVADGLIDLSPCIGIYQEAAYFEGYNIDALIDDYFKVYQDRDFLKPKDMTDWSTEKKILCMVSLETKQNRYLEQVSLPFVTEEQFDAISQRLRTRLSPRETIQKSVVIPFSEKQGEIEIFSAVGRCDVVKDNIVYELKFVSELAHVHFLQCAMYMIGLQLPRGILWNIRTNETYEITIPNRRAFLNKVALACTKGIFTHYAAPTAAIFNALTITQDTKSVQSPRTSYRALCEKDNKKVNCKFYIETKNKEFF